MDFKRSYWRIFLSIVLLCCLTGGAFAQTTQELLDSLIVSGNVRCGSGVLSLEAESPLEGDTLLKYNWYEVQGDTLDILIGSFDEGTYVTPELISSRDYAVRASRDGLLGARYEVQAKIENTASIREAPRYGLCADEVTLNAVTNLSSDKLMGANYYWQRFSVVDDVADYVNVDTTTVGAFTTDVAGFYRLIIVPGDGDCSVTSLGMEVTNDIIVTASISTDLLHCYGQDPLEFRSEYTRDIATYLWEESYDNVSYSTLSTAERGELQAADIDLPMGMNSRTLYLRLTVTEGPCSVSAVAEITIQRIPEAEITRNASTDDFFSFCSTDPVGDRTLTAAQINTTLPSVDYTWYRIQRLTEDGEVRPLDWAATNAEVLALLDKPVIEEDMLNVGTGQTLVLDDEDDWGWYFCQIKETDNMCFSFSNAIFANSAIADIVQVNGDICEENDNLTLEAFSPSNSTYQWSFSTSDAGPFNPISGATSDELVLTTPGAVEGFYRLNTTYNGCASDQSDPIEVVESPFGTATISAAQSFACENGTTSLLAVPEIDTAVLTWQYSDDNIAFSDLGQSGTSATVTGDRYYRLDVTNGACQAYTDTLFISEESAPGSDVSYDVSTPDFCSPVTISVDDQDASYSYQWYYTLDEVNVTTLADATGASYLTSDKGSYYAGITNSFGCITYSDTTLVLGNIDNTVEGYENGESICLDGSTIDLQLQNDVTYSYNWYYTADLMVAFALATGDNDSSRYGADNEGFYYARISNGDCQTNTDTLQAFDGPRVQTTTAGSGTSDFFFCPTDPDADKTFDAAQLTAFGDVSFSWEMYWREDISQDSAANLIAGSLDTLSFDSVGTGANYVIQNQDWGWYRSVITANTSGCTANSNVILASTTRAELGQLDSALCSNGDSLFLYSTGPISTSYQWQYADASLVFSDLTGATNDSLEVITPTFSEGSYRFTATENGCTATSDTTFVDVVSLASNVLSLDNTSICSTDTATMTLSLPTDSTAYDWQFSTDGGSFSALSEDTTTLLINTAGFYRANVSLDGCTLTTNTVQLTVNSVPGDTVSYSADPTTTCNPIQITLDDQDASYQYAWFSVVDSVTVQQIAAENGPSYTAAASGSYYARIENASGCVSFSDTTTVRVITSETVSIALTDSTVCVVDQTNLTIDLPSDTISFVWQFSADGVSFDSLTRSDTVISVNTAGFYRAIVDFESCTATTNVEQLTTIASAGTTVSYSPSTTTFCDPVQITLDDQDDSYEYTWFFQEDSTAAQEINGEKTPSYIASTAGSYYATIENDLGCISFSDTTTLRAQIDATITSVESEVFLCDAQSSVLLETTFNEGLTYQWLYTADSIFSVVSEDSLSASYNATQEGTYKVRVSNGLCTEESSPVDLEIDTTRIEGFEAVVTGSNRACDNEQLIFRSSYQSGAASYKWEYAVDNGSFELASSTGATWQTGLEDLALSGQTTYDVAVRLTIEQQGCVATSDSLEVTFYTPPDLEVLRLADNSTSTFVYCPSDSEFDRKLAVRQGETDYFPLTYQWELRNESGEYDSLFSGTATTYSLSSERGFLRVTSAVPGFETCGAVTNELFVESPSNSFIAEDVLLCESHPLGLLQANENASDSTLSDITYRWFYSIDNQVFIDIGGETNDTLVLDPASTGFGEGFYYFEATKSGCSVPSDTVEVTTRANTPFTIKTTDEFCSNSQGGSITVIIDNESSFTYALDSTGFFDETVFDSLSLGEYRVSVLDSMGCASTRTAEIFAQNNFEVFIEPDTLVIQQGLPFQLEASGAVGYSWFPAEFFQSTEGSMVTAFIPPDASDTLSLFVEGQSPEGCLATDVLVVVQEVTDIEDFEEEELIFSKVISPNGDRVNDEFEIIGLPQGIESELKILDKWGKVIFSANNYDAGSSQGTMLSEKLKEGTYFYLLTTPDFSMKGHFQVIK